MAANASPRPSRSISTSSSRARELLALDGGQDGTGFPELTATLGVKQDCPYRVLRV
jgi:hypothetical protein